MYDFALKSFEDTILETAPLKIICHFQKGSAEWGKPLESGRVSAPVTVRKKTKEQERYRGVTSVVC